MPDLPGVFAKIINVNRPILPSACNVIINYLHEVE